MIKIYPTHLTIELLGCWLSIDKTGIMAWNGKRNYFWIWK